MAKDRLKIILYNNEFYNVYYDQYRSAFIDYPCETCGKIKKTPIKDKEPLYKICKECSDKSEQRREKLSKASTGRKFDEEFSKKVSKAKLGKHIKTYVKTEEHIEKIRQTLLDKHYHLTEETKEKMSVSLKIKWESFSEEKKAKIIYDGRKTKQSTKPELIVESLLKNLFKDKYKYCGNNTSVINGISPDFISINDNKVIEVFGDYWHGTKVTGVTNQEHELERINKYKEKGFECLVIWECEIKENGCNEELINKLILFDNKESKIKMQNMFDLLIDKEVM